MVSSTFFRLLLAGAVATTLSFQACTDPASSDTGNNNNTTTVEPTVRPKLRSTFTFSIQKQGDKRVPVGSPTTETFTLEDTNGVALSQSGAYAFIGTDDRTIMTYDTTGNLSMYFYKDEIPDVPAMWVTIPFGTLKVQGSKTDTLVVDPNYPAGSVDMPLNVRVTSTRGSDTTMTIGGQALKVMRLEWKITHDLGSSRESFTYDMWYAPKLGYFVKWDHYDSGSFFQPQGGGEIRTLTSFTLK